MDLIIFWKNYGRELEQILGDAHKAESERLIEVIKHGNHYLLAEEKHKFEKFVRLQMIRGVVISMNRDENIDGQKP